MQLNQESKDWETVDIKELTVKIGDFGSSRRLSEEGAEESAAKLSIKGTTGYMAPEMRKALESNRLYARYNFKADVYSAALTALSLFTKDLEGKPEILSNI